MLVYPRTTYESHNGGASLDRYKSLDGMSMMSNNPVTIITNIGTSKNTFKTADGSNYQGWNKSD